MPFDPLDDCFYDKLIKDLSEAKTGRDRGNVNTSRAFESGAVPKDAPTYNAPKNTEDKQNLHFDRVQNRVNINKAKNAKAIVKFQSIKDPTRVFTVSITKVGYIHVDLEKKLILALEGKKSDRTLSTYGYKIGTQSLVKIVSVNDIPAPEGSFKNPALWPDFKIWDIFFPDRKNPYAWQKEITTPEQARERMEDLHDRIKLRQQPPTPAINRLGLWRTSDEYDKDQIKALENLLPYLTLNSPGNADPFTANPIIEALKLSVKPSLIIEATHALPPHPRPKHHRDRPPVVLNYNTEYTPAFWYNKLHLSDIERRFALPKKLMLHLIDIESKGDPNARSSKGAAGIFGVMPANISGYTGDVNNPAETAIWVAKTIRELADRFGSYGKALAAYNWGRGHLARRGFENIPPDTVKYVDHFRKKGVLGPRYAPGSWGEEDIPEPA